MIHRTIWTVGIVDHSPTSSLTAPLRAAPSLDLQRAVKESATKLNAFARRPRRPEVDAFHAQRFSKDTADFIIMFGWDCDGSKQERREGMYQPWWVCEAQHHTNTGLGAAPAGTCNPGATDTSLRCCSRVSRLDSNAATLYPSLTLCGFFQLYRATVSCGAVLLRK